MSRLSQVLNHLTGGKCAEVTAKPNDAIWSDAAKMQAALDGLVKWFPGAAAPTAQQVIDGAVAYQTWRDGEDAKAAKNAALAAWDAKGMARPVEDAIAIPILNGLIAKTKYAAQIIDAINAKRALRGEAPL